MAHVSFNNSLWIIGLLVQFFLLTLLFTRGIARSLRTFTVVLAFYPLRSLILRLIHGHIDQDAYGSLFNALSDLDIVLQLSIAIEVAIRFLRTSPGSNVVRGILYAVPVIAFLETTLLLKLLPAYFRAPDRFQIFASFIMLTLCFCMARLRAPALLRQVTLGFAIYGFAFTLAYSLQSIALRYHDVQGYMLWAYVPAVVYLLIVLYWIITLKPETADAKSSEPQPALL